MSSTERMRRAAFQATVRVPIYKVIPVAKYRDYAAIHYLGHIAPDRIPAYLSATGRIPTWRATSLMTAATALFTAGKDSDARRLALNVADADPSTPAPLLLLATLDTFHGNYPAGYSHAQDARLIDPSSTSAALQVLALSYVTEDEEAADATAIQTIEQFPHDMRILWRACKYCYSKAQLERIYTVWQAQSKTPKHVAAGTRPLALAALHVGDYALAMHLYGEASVLELRAMGTGKKVKQTMLAGKSGLSVLHDLRSVFEAKKVPFFFAAGTALGIVRDGRPLDHDYDIDVGVFEEDWNEERLVEAFREHPNFTLEPTNIDKPRLRLAHRGGAGIDIFQFYREGNHVFHDGKFVRWHNSTFEIGSFETANGESVPIPSDHERYLAENYGDWRTPDPVFDAFVDGPNAEITCPEYFQVHRARRAYKFICAGDFMKAHDELSTVKDRLEHSDSGRNLIAEMQL